jgi:hypothetical protein
MNSMNAAYPIAVEFFYTIQIFIPNSTGLAQKGFVFVTTYITYSVTSYVVAGGAIWSSCLGLVGQ